eukprot:CAMPEP_0181441118 /NCGR_PEP_ID=MMETSP1110-20121109/23338_1 /TAXON_ID=174948 /ORGANISM="Symbiodinium sp., Strain CCMP421" /LENGTH=574 /DNA_ID=CAMNT_0023564983 /DNA_START=40 /DNA_END=1764 /DNA_ORIENTATION=+
MRAVFALLSGCMALKRPEKPHLIMLVLDDVGWADVGYHGSNFPTPNIDSLVKSGVELDRMYAMPQCSPTRSSIMTGRWAWTIGMQHWSTILPGSAAGIPSDAMTLGEVMQKAGYDTHAIGKWHLGYSSKAQMPTSRGFNSYLGYLQGQTDYYNRTVPSCAPAVCFYRANCKGTFHRPLCSETKTSPLGIDAASLDFWDGEQPIRTDFGRYTEDAYMSRFKEILAAQNASTKPLFLYFAQQLLHIPLQLPSDPKHAEACRHVRGGSAEVNRTVLCAMASRLDEFMGEMVSLLKGAGMYENSLIWAFSDNGGMTQWSDMFPASASSNFPLRGGKTTLFEGGVRTPSFIFGGALPATARGSKRRELLHAVDILPTFAGLAGFDTTSLPINGQDMWGTITGSQVTARSELPLNIAMNRDLSATAIPAFGRGWSEANYTAVIQWPYKLILGEPFIANLMGLPSDKDRGGWWGVEEYSYTPPPDSEKKLGAWLYNIDQDEGEHNNLAEQLPEVVANITQRVTGWWFSNSKSGYRRPQLNIPRLLSNPMLQNWTWGPFAHLGHSADGSTDASTDSSVSLLV